MKPIYFLTSTNTIVNISVDVEEAERDSDPAVNASLALNFKAKLGTDTFKEQNKYIESAAIAAYSALNPIYRHKKYKSKINLNAISNEAFNFAQGSSSSGLSYSLAIFLSWWRVVLNKNVVNDFVIFATGEVSNTGEIFKIDFLNEKIQSLLKYVEESNIDNFILCYPQANDEDIDRKTIDKIREIGGKILCDKSIHSILEQIIGPAYDGNTAKLWEPFKGLKSYGSEDSTRFFFREKTITTIVESIQVSENPLLYLGSRQSGKTSLINAGLFPILDNEWNTLNISDFENLTDVYFEIIKFVGSESEKIKSINKSSLIVSELSLKIKDLEKVTDIALKAYESDLSRKLIIIDDFHLIFNTANKALKTQFISMLHILCSKGIKVVTFSNKEYIAYFEDRLLKESNFDLHFIDDFSIKDIENNIIKQVVWAGYRFEESKEMKLSNVITNDIAKYDVGINIANLLLKRLYEVATIENTKTFTLEHYERIGRFSGIFSELISEQISHNKMNKLILNRVFEVFYNDSITYSMNHTNPFELETMLTLGLLKYHPNRAHFVGQKLLYESKYYQIWLDKDYISWFEKIRASFFEWRVLLDEQVGFDDDVLLNEEEKSRIKRFREDYTNTYKFEEKIDSELNVGIVYFSYNNYIGIKDILIGQSLINSKVIIDEKMKLFIYLSHRKFLVTTATRFSYILLAFWIFYG